MAKYLVTGGAGFIGSHLVDELLERGHSVRVLDDFSTGRRANVPARDRLEVVEGDLAAEGVADRAVAGCDYVLHQAAIPSVPRSIQDPVASHRANVDATLFALIAARDAGVKRFIFAGSSAVYGDTVDLPKHEALPANPLSPYALQKFVSEEYCRLFTRLYRLETVTTRYFNVFGPRQQPGSPYSGVISLFIEALVEGRRPRVHGDGLQTRDFTYVGDVVRGVLACCEAPNVAGEVINIAAGGKVSLLQLLTTIGQVLGPTSTPAFGPPREGDVRDSQADISKARRLVGYEPRESFEGGLRKTIAWYQSVTKTPGVSSEARHPVS